MHNKTEIAEKSRVELRLRLQLEYPRHRCPEDDGE